MMKHLTMNVNFDLNHAMLDVIGSLNHCRHVPPIVAVVEQQVTVPVPVHPIVHHHHHHHRHQHQVQIIRFRIVRMICMIEII